MRMRHTSFPLVTVFATTLVVGALAAGEVRAAGLMNRVLRILGLTAAPGQMRGAGREPAPGRLWIADAAGDARRPLTTAAGFRSPLFEPGGRSVIALHGEDVVRVLVGAGGGPPK